MNKNPLIVFINPALGTTRYEAEDKLRSYLSLGTLASALRSRAFLKRFVERSGKKEIIFDSENNAPIFNTRVLNLSLKPESQTIKEFLTDFLKQFTCTPLMVCMTATSAQLDEAAAVALAAREIVPAAIRIIGGAHVSVAPVDYLKRSEFQLACIGEGVETLSELALVLCRSPDPDFSTIPGMAFKDGNGRVYLNSLRTPALELDEYPFPSNSLELFWERMADSKQNQNLLVYILAGYGCPHDCIFCAQRSIHHKKIRERSAENIFEEIRQLFARGFRKFAFVQETFLNRKKRIDAFCRLIEDAAMQIEWTAEARADQLAYGQLKRMQAAGLRFLQIGVESGDPALLKRLGKNTDLDQIRQVRNWCCELKISTAFYLLVGLPGQGWQSVWRSALFMRDHPPYNRITRHASVSIAIPYPGTKIWQDQSVRLIGNGEEQLNWPARNPAVSVNDAGEFVGKNHSETDDLTAAEILEAWIYLDDFCHFLLHAVNFDPHDASSSSRAKSIEYAARMSYMIQRRTIRDLIVRAHSNVTAEKRKTAYSQIVKMDEDVERHFKDVTSATEPEIDVLMRFLAAAQFLNGFNTMKWLSVANRIKWMKICAMLWQFMAGKISAFKFAEDHKETGLAMDRRLQALTVIRLNQCLAKIDSGVAPDLLQDINRTDQHISAFGFIFSPVGDRLFEVGLAPRVVAHKYIKSNM
jgi:anaerobic magnesium-protoporphyrin IX monomethyl ester cyclase